MKQYIQRFGKSLSSMVMPNIGAFIAWGFITALFIPTGWIPNERLGALVEPMLRYLLPLLIAIMGGRNVAGERGGVIAAVAVMGVIMGSDIPMFIGAMAIGPLAGWVIKRFDKFAEGRIPAGFEMLVNNFSVGILGIVCAIVGYYAIGPVVAFLTNLLSICVTFLVAKSLLPLVAILVEPAKVLFLNNAINHGIFSPVGIEQASLTGQSIMFLLETNPGPGLGVLLAYWAFAKGAAKSSAPGAIIIQFFGGIHEIYFPYVMMRPVVILAPILGSAAAILFYSIFNVGLMAVASPGSIIAVLAMAPKGSTLMVLIGIIIAAVVSFLVAAPIIRSGNIDEVKPVKRPVFTSDNVVQSATTQRVEQCTPHSGKVRKIIFACDAGMGSSAMGATRFRRRMESVTNGITVTNSSVDTVPSDADVVVCQEQLLERARRSAPCAEIVVIRNFLDDEALDALLERVTSERTTSAVAEVPTTSMADVLDNAMVSEDISEVSTASSEGILTVKGIKLGLAPCDKEQAIRAAGELLAECGYVEISYADAMVEREAIATTYLGMNIAIPHGTAEAKQSIKHSGIVVMQYPEGVDFGDEKAQLIIGIAGVGDEHLDILARLMSALEDEEVLEKLKTTDDVRFVTDTLNV